MEGTGGERRGWAVTRERIQKDELLWPERATSPTHLSPLLLNSFFFFFLAFFGANCKIMRRRGAKTEGGVRQGIRKVVDETGRIKTVRGTIAGVLTTQGLG